LRVALEQWNTEQNRQYMKHIPLASLLIGVCLVALAGCGGGSSSPTPTPTPTPTPGGTSPTTVSIPLGASGQTTGAYVPDSINVSVGTTVKWTNNDAIAHDVTSKNNLFFSGNMGPGATFSQTFQSTGTFPYYCTIHSGMTGTVTVQ
jgi:plastocyanin